MREPNKLIILLETYGEKFCIDKTEYDSPCKISTICIKVKLKTIYFLEKKLGNITFFQ